MSIRLVHARDVLATEALCEGVGVGVYLWVTPRVTVDPTECSVMTFSKQQEYGFCKVSEANQLLVNHINN